LLMLITILRLSWSLRLRTDDNEALHVLSLLYTRGTVSADINEKVINAVQGLNSQNQSPETGMSNSPSFLASQSRAELLRYQSNFNRSVVYNDMDSSMIAITPEGGITETTPRGGYKPPSIPTKVVPPHTLRFDSFQYNLLIAMLRGTIFTNNSTVSVFSPCQCFQVCVDKTQPGNHHKSNFVPFLNFNGKYGVCPHTYLGFKWLTGISNLTHGNNYDNVLGEQQYFFSNFGQNNSNQKKKTFLPHQTKSGPKKTSFDTLDVLTTLPDGNSPQHSQHSQHSQTSPNSLKNIQTDNAVGSFNDFDCITGTVSITATSKLGKINNYTATQFFPALPPQQQEQLQTNPTFLAAKDMNTTRINLAVGFYSTHGDDTLGANMQGYKETRHNLTNSTPPQAPKSPQLTSKHANPIDLTAKTTKNGLYHPFENQEE